MLDYIKPTERTSILIFISCRLEQTTSHLAIYLNNLRNILLTYFCQFSKDRHQLCLFFNIVPRGDKKKEKAEKAIQIINNASVQCNIPVINNTNIDSKRHLKEVNCF